MLGHISELNVIVGLVHATAASSGRVAHPLRGYGLDYVQVMEVDRGAIPDALLEHLEAALGPLDESRSVSESFLVATDGAEFGVVAFGSRGPTTFASFGISRHLLGDTSDFISQELLVAVEDRDFAVNLLSTIGRHVLDNHQALRVGERHRLPGWNEASAIAGVMAVPDPVVAHFEAGHPQIHFLRLLPITDAEAAYANERGWHELAEALAESGVDLSDLLRSPVG